jgi:membrane protein involved in D-alanine export
MRFIMTAMRGRWFASKIAMSCLGFYVSFGLMGVWHGLAPRYLVYGFYHATLVAGHTLLADHRKLHQVPRERIAWNPLGTFVTFHLVCFGLLIFSGRLG